jgi:hypothetical protein
MKRVLGLEVNRRRPARRSCGDRGAVLVETAGAISVLTVFMMGILTYGLLFNSTLDIAGAAGLGARAGTQTSSLGPPSDEAILRQVANAPGVKRTQVETVVIFKAEPGQSEPPQACLLGAAVTGKECNVYRGSEIFLTGDELTALPGSQNWPSTARVPGRDYIGVFVRTKFEAISTLIWSPRYFDDNAIMRLEAVPTNVSPSSPGEMWTSGTDVAPPWNLNWYCWGSECPLSGPGWGDAKSGGGGSS